MCLESCQGPDINTMAPDCVARARALAKTIAKTRSATKHIDDLVSSAILGLIEALQAYDPSVGTKPWTFARHRVKGAVLDELKFLRSHPQSLGDYEPEWKSGRVGWEIESQDEYEKMTEILTENEKAACDAFYMKAGDRNQPEGWTRGYAITCRHTAIRKLRNHYGVME